MDGPEIKPGETTSEHAIAQSNSFWGIALAVAGGILAIVPQIIEQLQAVEAVQNSKYGMLALTIMGALVTLSGIVMKQKTGEAYIDGRSRVKAAAALPPPPPKI